MLSPVTLLFLFNIPACSVRTILQLDIVGEQMVPDLIAQLPVLLPVLLHIADRSDG